MSLVAVIGAGGQVGSFITEKLSAQCEVLAIDVSEDKLSKFEGVNNIFVLNANETDDLIKSLRRHCPLLVVVCIPGSVAFEVVQSVIEEGFSIVDVSFYAEDSFHFQEIVQSKRVLYIPDSGIAPGFTNMLASLWYSDNALSFRAYIGGLPQNPTPPLFYNAPFNASDSFDEYLRPARIKRCGNIEVIEPLRIVEWLTEFEDTPFPLGAIYTDGLRTLLKTMEYQDMAELTIRYKPHLDYILDAYFKRTLNTSETKESFVKYAGIPTDDVTFFFAKTTYRDGSSKEFRFVHFKQGWHSSMASLTGSVALGIVDWYLEEKPDIYGVIPPELIAQSTISYVLRRLEQVGVDVGELKRL